MNSAAAWLEKLGLSEYINLFAEHKLDAEILPELTEQDLRELGIPLGHRKKLLKAIAAFAIDNVTGTALSSPVQVASTSEAERRQLTVMFVDLAGSTALSERLDPEDLSAIIRAYQNTVVGEITRFEGHVAKFMGDGILVYFGYPQAHEDEAERAVRAGLAAVAAVAQLRTPANEALAARVGIATGLVVVGELVGKGAAQEEAVMGETPNLAARLQALAEPDSVVIADSTRRLSGGVFDYIDLGAQTLKGFSQRMRAWQVCGLRAAESRFAARGQRLTPLIGREAELNLLIERWQQARAGEGQVVLLSGEPGIGKSCLIQAVSGQIAGQPHTRLSYQCSPYHTNSALFPYIQQLEREAGFSAEDSAAQKLGKLEALLAQSAHSLAEVTPLLAALLSIPAAARYPLPELTPQRQKQLTLEALIDQLEGTAAQQPVLFILEDAHWIDPTTRELMGLAIDRIRNACVLMLITFRPEFAPPWKGHAHVTALTMNKLGRQQATALVEKITGGKTLPGELLAQILSKTDGVPLFIEELAKTVLESGLLKETEDRYLLDGPLPPLAVPSTLQDSLLARLDRLASVKEIAQIGAVIGREFSYELISAVTEIADGELQAGLVQLIDAGLVFDRGRPPQASYTFKHALVQDAAYQSLLKRRRQEIHARVARVLEARFAEQTQARPELLAHHYTDGGLNAEAVDYWIKAGRQASDRSAYLEALAFIDKGLALLEPLPASAKRTEQALGLQSVKAGALMALRGFTAAETGEAFVRARELCRELGDPPEVFALLGGLFNFHWAGARYGAALEVAEECQRLAQAQDDNGAVAHARRYLGRVFFAQGKLSAARRQLEQAAALYDPQQHSASASFYGLDAATGVLTVSGPLLCLLGYSDQALAAAQTAVSRLQQPGHAHLLAIAWTNLTITRQLRREYRLCADLAQRHLALAREHGLKDYIAVAALNHSWARAALGESGAQTTPLRSSIDALQTHGYRSNISFRLGGLAEALAVRGQWKPALSVIGEALAFVDQSGERWSEAELWRLKGEILLRQSASDTANDAEACFQQALAIARGQEAKWWELRTAVSLAHLWHDQGKRRQACKLLASVYNWFTEGFDTADLQDAKGLLDELR